MTKTSLAFLLAMAILLISCGNDSKPQSSEQERPVVNSIYVKGDPLNLLKGTEANKISPVKREQLSWYKGFQLFSVYTFKELGQSRFKGLEEKDIEGKELFSFKKGKGKKWIYRSKGKSWSVVFKEDETGRLNLIGVKGKRKRLLKAKALHYSFKKSGGAFSISMELDFDGSLKPLGEKREKVLAFLTFVKKKRNSNESLLSYLNQAYIYLFGAGRGVRWDPVYTHFLDICEGDPKQQQKLKSYLEESIKPWNRILAGYPKIEVRIPETFYPMGDLNQNCIFLVDSYSRTAQQHSYSNPGTAYMVGKISSGRLLTGDIVLWRDEFEKYGSDFFSEDLKPYVIKTLKHELGHWLGLGHQFDPNTPSIMGYGPENELTEYDKQAVLELYSF